MSLIPFILDLADELHEFSRCLATGSDINDFGFGLYTGSEAQQQQSSQQQQQQQQQQSPRRCRTSSFSSLWMPSKRHHPYNRIKTACCAKTTNATAGAEDANASNPDVASSSSPGTPGKSASYSVVNKNGFQVSMNVKQFAPNELSVKTIDNCIVVEGRHDDKEDGHGVISRHFVRKYMLPKGYDPNDVLSTLSSDGILTVKAPPPPPPATKNDEHNERIIEIQPTPGPTPVVVVSSSPAKEATTTTTTTPQAPQIKEQTKKVTSSPTRLECQLPEKRQKLELSNEQQQVIMTEKAAAAAASATPPPPSAAAATETDAATKTTETDTATAETNDVEMEKVDDVADEDEEETAESDNKKDEQPAKRQKCNDDEVVDGAADNADAEEDEEQKTAEMIEKLEKSSELQKLVEEINETEDKDALDEEKLLETNGETINSDENLVEPETIEDPQEEEESCINADNNEDKENVEEVPAEILSEIEMNNEEKSDISKMEVDEEEQEEEILADNTEVVVATIITTETEVEEEDEANIAAAAIEEEEEEEDVPNDKTNNSDTSNTTTNTTTTTTTTTSKTETNTDKAADKKITTEEGNGIVTGKLPVDIPNSNDEADDDDETAVAATKTATNDTNAAESALDGDEEIEETAVLTTTTTTTDTTNTIDEVALLKAAVTADPIENSADAETDENVILSEPMEGIVDEEEEETSKMETTTTTTNTKDCSLFKKSHLGNGNTTTALVVTEEMAN